MGLGVSAADEQQKFADMGRTVTYYASTVAFSNISGDQTITLAAGVPKTWIFLKSESENILEQVGIFELADAYVIIPTTDVINYRDRILVDGETYEVTPDCKVVKRYFGSTLMFTYATLKKVA